MAITQAEILVVLNARLTRTETDIDEEIRSALYDLSKMAKWRDLHTSDVTAIVKGEESVSAPSDLLSLDTGVEYRHYLPHRRPSSIRRVHLAEPC